MRWNFLTQSQLRDAGARFRAEHSAFLTKALMLEKWAGRRYPRIPTKRVDQGGFDKARRVSGDERFEQWWQAAMRRVER